MRLTRRGLLIGLGGAAAATTLAVTLVPRAGQAGETMTPAELHDAVLAGAVVLIDVRRPDEWTSTGLAAGAVPIDLRDPDFITKVRAAQGQAALPIAVICARGVRSRRMAGRLEDAGLAPIVDIPEGMLGSRAGPGWIKAGLPLENWKG